MKFPLTLSLISFIRATPADRPNLRWMADFKFSVKFGRWKRHLPFFFYYYFSIFSSSSLFFPNVSSPSLLSSSPKTRETFSSPSFFSLSLLSPPWLSFLFFPHQQVADPGSRRLSVRGIPSFGGRRACQGHEIGSLRDHWWWQWATVVLEDLQIKRRETSLLSLSVSLRLGLVKKMRGDNCID